MQELLYNMPAMLLLTLGSYLAGVWVKTKTRLSLLHPFLISIPVIIAVLKAADIPYEFYFESNRLIDFLLGPSVVSLGLLMYDHIETIRKHFAGIMISVISGSVTGVVSVYVLAKLMKLDEIFIMSLEPKSVTTPIAMDISASLGGNVSLTAVSVVLCGLVGAVFGPLLLRLLRIKSPVARGLAMGCAAHGLGTSRAIEMGAVEGALSGLAIALMGIMTAVATPLLNLMILKFF